MDPHLQVILSIVVVFLVLMVSFPILTKILAQESEANAMVNAILRPRQQTIKLLDSEPDICIQSVTKREGKWDYKVNLASMNVKAVQDVAIYPALRFKGERTAVQDENGDIVTVFNLRQNEMENIGEVFDIRSIEPPMIKVNDADTIYNYLDANVKQKILMSNFLIEYVNYLQGSVGFLGGAIDIPISSCAQEIAIDCATEETRAFLVLPDENGQCNNAESCSKNFNLCSGEISVELLEFGNPDAQCAEKEPRFKFTVIEPAEKWNIGEEAVISFWEYQPDNLYTQNCWKQELTTLTETCINMSWGIYKVYIPPGRCSDT